jgi:hypothetical protein
MIKLIVQHPVQSFNDWHRAYKSFAEIRNRFKVRSDEVFQAVEDPNLVTVAHVFDSLTDAQTMLASEDLKTALAKAGVCGPPTIWMMRPPA